MCDELSEVTEYLKSIADRFGIEYFWPSALSPSTPPAAKPSKKRIVMNPNWHNKREIPFQFAHEIAHILNDDDTNWVYYYQGVHNGVSKLEYETNRIAIRIVLSYFNQDEIEYNPVRFMQAFAIPDHLSSAVNEELSDYCTGLHEKVSFGQFI